MKDRVLIAYQWRLYRVMIGFMVLEVPLTIAALALFGIADGDTYRTKLWQNGADYNFNSAPSSILYQYANHVTPVYPVVWGAFMTEFNIVVSVLSMFLLLTKSVMYMLHVLLPILSVVVHALLVALWAASLSLQSTPDHSDPDSEQLSLPWYLSKGCGYASSGNMSYCIQARSAFGVTCVMVALFSLNLVWSVYNLLPTQAERAERTQHRDIAIELKSAVIHDEEEADDSASKARRSRRATAGGGIGARFKLDNIPKTPQTATRNLMTPRTKAFSVLNGGGVGEASAVGRKNGPVAFAGKKRREGDQNGDAVVKVSTGVGPSRPLAFREQYSESGKGGDGEGV